jgi:hypothetical protein
MYQILNNMDSSAEVVEQPTRDMSERTAAKDLGADHAVQQSLLRRTLSAFGGDRAQRCPLL